MSAGQELTIVPSDQYIIDNGGSVTYRGYEVETTDIDPKLRYFARQIGGDGTRDIGLCRNVAEVKKAISRTLDRTEAQE